MAKEPARGDEARVPVTPSMLGQVEHVCPAPAFTMLLLGAGVEGPVLVSSCSFSEIPRTSFQDAQRLQGRPSPPHAPSRDDSGCFCLC